MISSIQAPANGQKRTAAVYSWHFCMNPSVNLEVIRAAIDDLRLAVTQAYPGNGEKPPQPGNIGLAVFEHAGLNSGVLWAASRKVVNQILTTLANTRPKGQRILLRQFEKELKYQRIINGITQPACGFSETFPAVDQNRQHDSEYLLLNATHALIQVGRLQPSVHVHLFTELQPCSSCCAVILAFLQANPDANLTVYYSFTSDIQATAAFGNLHAIGFFNAVTHRLFSDYLQPE